MSYVLVQWLQKIYVIGSNRKERIKTKKKLLT